MSKTLICPACESENVVSEYHQMVYVNTGEHYCHSMKAHDSNSPTTCLDCEWKGVLSDLGEK